MDAKAVHYVHFYASMNSDKAVMVKPAVSLQCSPKFRQERKNLQMMVSRNAVQKVGSRARVELPDAGVSCSYEKFPASTLDTGSLCSAFDDGLVLKNKSQEIMSFLDGRCIYLIGMMGSGKTTVGRILADFLGYCFRHSDKIVEQSCGKSVAELFQLYGKGYFREKESEAIRTLSLMQRLVVSTGGGAVVRPINCYTYKNFALALVRLSTLFEERADDYANANDIAAKMAHRDVSNLTPTIIAIETLLQIDNYLRRKLGMPL